MAIYQIVKALQDASGNNEKLAILEANKDNDLFKAYMQAVYDPAVNYYVTKLPTGVAPGNMARLDQEYLNWLAKSVKERKFVGKAGKSLLKVTLATFDAQGQELFGYIIDRKIGANVGDTMVLTTWPGLYFIPPYMRCASMDEKARERFDKEEYFYVQEKRDGSFAYLNPGRICTRQGSCYPDWFVGRMSAGVDENEVLVGEMEVYRHAATDAGFATLLSRKEGNGVLNSILQGAEESEFEDYEFRYIAWDLLSLGEFETGYSGRPYEDRWDGLRTAVASHRYNASINVVQCWKVTSVAMAKARHTSLTAAGLEGSVWKTASGVWKDTSSGSKDNVKVKVVFEAEYVIVGSFEGKGKAKGKLGGLTIATECEKLTNDVGTGFSDKQREDLWAIRDQLPGKVVTCEANDISTARGKNTYSLSLPVFIEIRHDRTIADTLERVLAQFEAAKLGKKLAE
jgi:hypothetical protein